MRFAAMLLFPLDGGGSGGITSDRIIASCHDSYNDVAELQSSDPVSTQQVKS